MKVAELEVPPPGVALNTVTVLVPEVSMSLLEIEAVIWVEDTKVVVRFDPFHLTTEVGVKPLPLTVRVKAPLFLVREEGLKLDMAGSGLLTVKVWELEVPPPGLELTTVTGIVAPLAISAAVIAASS